MTLGKKRLSTTGKEHVKNSLFLKYYVPMANFNKVTKYKGFKYKICSEFAIDSIEAKSRQLTQWYFAIECVISIALALKSIANSLQILYLKPL